MAKVAAERTALSHDPTIDDFIYGLGKMAFKGIRGMPGGQEYALDPAPTPVPEFFVRLLASACVCANDRIFLITAAHAVLLVFP
jgi:hypothetical protein